MKKFFVLLAAMAMTFGANAQIVESSAKTIKVEPAKPVAPKSGYNRIMFNYSPLFGSSVYNGKSADESSTMNGGSISYTRGIAVSKRLPMFIETGLGWQFNTDKSLDLMRLNIPVAFTYRFGFGQNKQIKISPFTGLNFGINVMTSLSDSYYGSKSARKADEDNYKSFQMGWLIGANFTFKRFNIQIAYTFDFMPLYKRDASTEYTGFGEYAVIYNIPELKINTGVLNVGVGFEF